jgi:hypothetical protein
MNGQKVHRGDESRILRPLDRLLCPMKSEPEDPPKAAAEESEERRSATTSPSDETPASFPVIRRSSQRLANLDERLRRVFAILSLPPQDW